HGAQIGPEEISGRPEKAPALPSFHAEGLYNAIAGNGFVENILYFRELVLSFAGRVPYAQPNLPRGEDDEWNKDQKYPGQLASQGHHDQRCKNQGEKLLKELRHHRGERILNLLNVV